MSIIPILFVLLYAGFSFGETYWSGIIKKDVEWRAEQSPYIITGDIFVEVTAVLKIEPGTIIKVGPKDTANLNDTSAVIKQIDQSDSSLIAIKVNGGILCDGSAEARIKFSPIKDGGNSPIGWYGIVINNCNEDYTSIGHTDISGAVYGVMLRRCDCEIYNSIFSFNNTAIYCGSKTSALIRNNTIADNIVSGIFIVDANPRITSNIIAFNRNHGIWSDGVSLIEVDHNCIYGNLDGNLIDCPTKLGTIKSRNARGDSCDKWYNIYKNPVFAGSIYDSIAVEKDTSLTTDASKVKDTLLAKVADKKLLDNQAAKARRLKYQKYFLGGYSPCIDAGKSSKKYSDLNGTKNDMGAYGGPLSKLK